VAALVLDPEDLRGPLATLASEQLERPVELGEMEVGLFPTPVVRVAGVRIGAERLDAPPLAEVAEIRLRPALLPLLLGRVVVSTLEIREPVVRLELAGEERPEPTVPTEPRAGGRAPDAESSAPVLAVRSIRVVGGRLEAGPWRVENVDVDGALNLDATATLRLEADLPGVAGLREVTVELEGLLGDARVATLEGRLVDADLAGLAARLGSELEVAGRAEGTFSARIEGQDLTAAVLQIDAEAVEVVGAAFSLRGRVPLRAELGGPFALDLRDAALDVGESLRKPVGGELRAEGTLPPRFPPQLLEEVQVQVGPSRLALRVDVARREIAVADSALEIEPLRGWLVDPPDGLTGRLEIEKLALRAEPFALSGRLHLAGVSFALENGVVTLSGPVEVSERELVADPLEVRLAGEPLRASARYPLSRGTSTFTLSVDGSQLGPVLEALSGRRDIDGALRLDATIHATDDFARLRGDGRFELVEGRIHGFSLAGQALGELAALPLIVGQLRGKDLTAYFEEEFDRASATFRLENHELATDDLTIVQDYTRAELRGRIGLLDRRLALSGRLVIEEELDAELGGESRGRERVIPITSVGGTLDRPKVRLDQQALAELAASYATSGSVREKLEEKIGGEGADAVQDLLEQILRRRGEKQ
jgi:hypothetical protein